MSAVVKPYVPSLSLSEISTGSPVRGQTWIGAVDIANYLRGHGRQLIPMFSPKTTIPTATTRTFRFRCYTSAASRARVWTVMLSSADTGSASAYVRMRAPASTGADQYLPVGSLVSGNGSLFAEYVEIASGADAEEELTIDLRAESDDSVNVLGISCVELPRTTLDLDATDLGVDVNTVPAREPIIEVSNAGMLGAYDVLSNRGSGSRGGIYYWANDTASPASVTATSYSAISGFTLDLPALGRRLASATSTSSSIHWRIYAKTDANATTGDVRVTTAHGSDTISLATGSHTAFAWYPSTGGSPNSFSVDCEDYASTAGLQTAGTPAFDSLTFTAKTGGSGTLSIAAISVWENVT